MPLDQAVLEHQVVGGVPAEEGQAPQVDVIVVAARRDMVSSFVEPLRSAGLEPVGVDLSAFGMIRALSGSTTPRSRLSPVSAPPPPCSTATSATSPTSPWPAVPPASSPASPTPASSRSRPPWSRPRGLTRSTPRSGSATSVSSGRWRRSRAIAETVAQVRGVLEDGVATLLDELRLSLDYYGAQEAALPVERIVLCGPGSAIPGLAARMEAGLGSPISVARPSALSELRRGRGGTPHPSLRPRPGELSRAPGQPDPTRGPPRRSGAAANRTARLHPGRRPGRSPWPGSPRWSSPTTRSPNARASSPKLEGEDAAAAAKATRLAAYTQFRQLSEQRVATVQSLADSRFDWERVMRELALILPGDVWLVNLTATAAPGRRASAAKAAAAEGAYRSACLRARPGARTERLRRRSDLGRRVRHRAQGHRRSDPRRRRVLRTA